ncbi:hypothetical protein [Encephalitozoon cuniculi GB-M1]|uniref:Uncharacterized protein n=1 Tax=Encephalitozoon cuniculi (strain GB-M1) TaxID=284813 RepID=Q8SVV9_ENCCU|nr:uncharacterized protein ECU04_0540 [Encephalitozoon cuniculi GB-M1]CAD25241.1 hypothetical protein [Encephalitozoon cuniculi GB-M1]
MRPNTHLKKLLKIDVSPDSSYPDIEIALSNLRRIIKSASQKEVIRGGVRKMILLFHSKNRTAKSLALKYLSKVNRHVDEIDTNILYMFYSTDPRINDLAVRYVHVFSRFFKDNDIVFYHVYRSDSKYRKDAMRALISQSPKYRVYEKECGTEGDLDLFGNVRRSTPEEYFGRLALPKLVVLASTYPCLVKYFKFTKKFLMEEVHKDSRYPPGVLRRLRALLGAEKGRDTMWDEFLKCLGWMKHGRFGQCVPVLKNLSSLEISREYKTIFNVFVRKMLPYLSSKPEGEKKPQMFISSSFEIELSGLSRNGVYRVLLRLFKHGAKHVDGRDRRCKNV